MFTCNQKFHFGTAQIKNYVFSNDWINHFPDYNDLTRFEKEEIKIAITQLATGLLLRN